MKTGNWFSERVYLCLGHDFFGATSTDFGTIIEGVALSVEKVNGEKLYTSDKNGKNTVFTGKTKKLIAREANKFIANLGEVIAEESARSLISKSQIDKLSCAFRRRKGRISCYSLVILHVCFTLMNNKSDENLVNQLTECAQALVQMCQVYYNAYGDDLALFLLKCYPPVIAELTDSSQCSEARNFPPIPKRAPMEPADEQ